MKRLVRRALQGGPDASFLFGSFIRKARYTFMIGIYDYTVVLTYCSLISASLGIIVCLHGIGHPFHGVFFLLLSGLCDTFDGRVARSKKNRTAMEKSYGIQIDSLADLVAFGILPGCIGIAMLRVSKRFSDVPHIRHVNPDDKLVLYPIALMIIVILYILAAMIRLAYFNVMEEERSHTENTARRYYTGLPVTSAALIFPTVMLIQFLTETDLTMLYFGVMAVVSFLFVSKIRVRKPGLKLILAMIAIGAVEFALLFFIHWRAGGI